MLNDIQYLIVNGWDWAKLTHCNITIVKWIAILCSLTLYRLMQLRAPPPDKSSPPFFTLQREFLLAASFYLLPSKRCMFRRPAQLLCG